MRGGKKGIVPPGLRTSVGFGSGPLAAHTSVTLDGVALFRFLAMQSAPVAFGVVIASAVLGRGAQSICERPNSVQRIRQLRSMLHHGPSNDLSGRGTVRHGRRGQAINDADRCQGSVESRRPVQSQGMRLLLEKTHSITRKTAGARFFDVPRVVGRPGRFWRYVSTVRSSIATTIHRIMPCGFLGRSVRSDPIGS